MEKSQFSVNRRLCRSLLVASSSLFEDSNDSGKCSWRYQLPMLGPPGDFWVFLGSHLRWVKNVINFADCFGILITFSWNWLKFAKCAPVTRNFNYMGITFLSVRHDGRVLKTWMCFWEVTNVLSSRLRRCHSSFSNHWGNTIRFRRWCQFGNFQRKREDSNGMVMSQLQLQDLGKDFDVFIVLYL